MVEKLGKSNSCLLFGASGTMESLERVHISKGTKIYAFGFGMSQQFFVVCDENMNCVEICDGNPDEISEFDLERYFSPRHHLNEETRPISKKFGIGFYYDESDEIISDEIIEKSLKRADNIEKMKEDVKKRKEQESKEKTESLKKQYGKILEKCEHFDHKTCGKNIRRELKENFPGIKFSVRYSSFSGGDSYDISWEDGPTQKAVDDIVKKYQDMHPDSYSMGDYWDCIPSEFNNLYGSVGYVMTQREISKEKKDLAESILREKGVNEENIRNYKGDDKDIMDIIYGNSGVFSFEELKRCYAYKIDWYQYEKNKKNAVRKTESTGDFKIIDYSEKAIALVGDTKKIKEELKKLGGRFNPRLSCGAGWIFSKKKEDELRKIIG